MPGCATALSSPPPTVVTQCPPLNSYDRKQLDALADEIERDPSSVRNKFITDYSKLRDACRRIEAKKK